MEDGQLQLSFTADAECCKTRRAFILAMALQDFLRVFLLASACLGKPTKDTHPVPNLAPFPEPAPGPLPGPVRRPIPEPIPIPGAPVTFPILAPFHEPAPGPLPGPVRRPIPAPIPIPGGPVTLPELPASLLEALRDADADQFANIWGNRLRGLKEELRGEETSNIAPPVPKVIVTVIPFKMSNLVPADAPHPLYSDKETHLTNYFILDSLSSQSFNVDDPKLNTPDGLVIQTLSGKELVIKRKPDSDLLTVNDILVDKIHQNVGEAKMVVLVLNDFLFTHYDDVKKAFSNLAKDAKFINIHTPPLALQPDPLPELPVPEVPHSLEKAAYDVGASGLINIWRNRVDQYINTFGKLPKRDEGKPLPKPRSIFAVTFFKMVNIVPQDAPNPLYSDKFKDLTDKFILDSISDETVNLDNPTLDTPNGLTIHSLSKKDIVVKRDSETNKLTANGIEIVDSHQDVGKSKGEEPITVFVLGDFLFNHYQEVQEAFHSFTREDHDPFIHSVANRIPDVPPQLLTKASEVQAADLIKIWQKRKEQHYNKLGANARKTAVNVEAPRIVLAIEPSKMAKFLPENAPNLLLSEIFTDLADNFILDSLSTETLTLDDPNLATSEGVTLQTISGKDLVFKKVQNTDNLAVNEVETLNIYDGVVNNDSESPVTVIVLKDFLFSNQNDLHNALNSEGETETEDPESIDATTPLTSFSLPDVPLSIATTAAEFDALPLVNIWKNRIESLSGLITSMGDTADDRPIPKLVLAVTPVEMATLIPQDAPHPLYAVDRFPDLIDDFLLDSISNDIVKLDDPKLGTPEGLTIKTMGGKDLLLKNDEKTGKLSVNGIEVEQTHQAKDKDENKTCIFILKDFLFDSRKKVNDAFKRLSEETNQTI